MTPRPKTCRYEVAVRNPSIGVGDGLEAWPQFDPREWFEVYPCRSLARARELARGIFNGMPWLITAVRPRAEQ